MYGMRTWRVAVGLALVAGSSALWADEASTPSPMRVAMSVANEEAGPSAVPADSELHPEPMRLSMEFQNASLKDVLKTFSKQTGINVIAGEDVADKTITLYLEDVSAMDALDQILSAANLSYERQAGSQIYRVKAKPADDPKLHTLTKVYRLKYARVSSSRLARAVEALGSITPFEAQQLTSLASSSSGGASGSAGSTLGIGSGGGGALGGGAQSKDVGVDKVLQELLTDQGKLVVDERTNSVVVSDVPANFPRIEAALAALDQRTGQLLIEAELLETTLAKVKNLGVQWGSGTEGTMFNFTPASRTTRFPFSILGDKSGAATTITGGTVGFNNAAAALQMLERDTDTKILARPKVLTLDNESAVIRLTAQQAIGFQSNSQTQTGTQSVTPERTTTGVILVVTPQINSDGYITMLVEPSVTKVVTSQVTPPATLGTIVDPKTRSTRALVRIKDGETLVMGGLIDRSDERTLQKVPILGDIPLVGEAFRDRKVNRSESELVVFISPRILSEPHPAKVASATSGADSAPEMGDAPSRSQLMEDTLNKALEKHAPRDGSRM